MFCIPKISAITPEIVWGLGQPEGMKKLLLFALAVATLAVAGQKLDTATASPSPVVHNYPFPDCPQTVPPARAIDR